MITSVTHMRHRFTESTRPLKQMPNRFVIALVRASLALKRQRAEAEARAQQQAEERRVQEEQARRVAEAQLRWREEEGRIERLEQLAAMWQRRLELKALATDVQHAVGDVAPESELGAVADVAARIRRTRRCPRAYSRSSESKVDSVPHRLR